MPAICFCGQNHSWGDTHWHLVIREEIHQQLSCIDWEGGVITSARSLESKNCHEGSDTVAATGAHFGRRMGSSVDQGCTGRTLLAAEWGGAKKRVNSQNMIWIIWIIPCNCLSNFNGLKSTLPRCAPQVLVIFTGWDNWQSLLLLLLLRGTRAPPAANGSQPKMALRETLVPKNR